jgi:hypothetical protein
VLGYDKGERIVLAHEVAGSCWTCRRLRGPPAAAGAAAGPARRRGHRPDRGSDLLVLHDDRVLVANRMPIRHERRHHLGWVVTFRDRTESRR